MYDTSPERCVPEAVPGVAFMLINAALCLQPQFDILHNQIFKFIAIVRLRKLACISNYREKQSFPWRIVSNMSLSHRAPGSSSSVKLQK